MWLTATLVGDGRSDRTLIPIIQLVLDNFSPHPYVIHFAENLSESNLSPRICEAMKLYPCHLLFIHRDAENQDPQQRDIEIEHAMASIPNSPGSIRIVPVRMTEAWLLPHEQAIRRAANNPNGKIPLNLPSVKKIENLPDPKESLFQAIRTASEQSTQRRAKFNVHRARHRVSELLTEEDLICLRELPSFQHFESQVRCYFQKTDRA